MLILIEYKKITPSQEIKPFTAHTPTPFSTASPTPPVPSSTTISAPSAGAGAIPAAPTNTAENKALISKPTPIVQGLNLEVIENDVLETICAQTGYPRDMVEIDIDLEADLGVDTVKKMEIIADLSEKYKLKFRKDFNITNLSTVRKISQLIYEDSQIHHA